MKTILCPLLAALALFTVSGRAQDVFVSGAPGSVTYYAVTPQAPVTYPVPVAYAPTSAWQVPPACAAPAACAPPAPVYNQCSPSVVYFGGTYRPYNAYSSTVHCGYASPTVIYFGRGQAYRQGYTFGHRR